MKKAACCSFVSILLFFICYDLFASISLPGFFSDNMVLQRDIPVKIWGRSGNNEQIQIDFNGISQIVKADKKGNWLVELPAMDSGGPFDLIIKGKNESVSFKNILIGDVWICGGQSNMDWVLINTDNAGEAIESSVNSHIRFLTIGKTYKTSEAYDIESGKWQECNPETSRYFSAVGYYFGKNLQRELNVPVGLINSSMGGTDIQPWISWETMIKTDAYKEFKGKTVKRAIASSPEKTEKVNKLGANGFASLLYNAMIHPLVGYGIKGVIWYQGENNAYEAYRYRKLFPDLIFDWRTRWGYDFPFLWVQLANFMKESKQPQESQWAELREAQNMTLSVAGTGQAVTIDIGDADDIHPRNKKDVGLRLALNAFLTAYDMDTVAYGPMYESMQISAGQIVLSFKKSKSGLAASDKNKYGYLKGFTIAGNDKQFVWAKAYISGDKVIVFNEDIKNPVAVRYAWADNPGDANFINNSGLPASPFRTDSWEGITLK